MLRRQFAQINFKDLTFFDRHLDELLSDLAKLQGVADLQPSFFLFTLATTTSLIFGENISRLDPEADKAFADALDYASSVTSIRLRLADLHWLYAPSKFKEACLSVKRYASGFVDRALKDAGRDLGDCNPDQHTFILDLYSELKDAVLVRDQLVNVLIAGRDTAACILSWTLY